jgi:alcohol dehydrogenase class IV
MEIGEKCSLLGIKNPLIVTDKGSADLPFIEKLETYLSKSNISFASFKKISPNPLDTDIAAGKQLFLDGNHDAVIAIGGGSAMDGGKGICMTAKNSHDLWDFEFEKPSPVISASETFPKLITIPTTAGTGAETESTAMVTDTSKAMKFCVWHKDLKPELALLDPELTIGLPETYTAWTGVDAMVHAIEAYLVPDFHPLCDGAALEGLTLVNTWLPVAVQEPKNIFARGGMLVGSCLAGIAFLKGLGLVHAISHMVGAEFDTQHGLTNAIILPSILKYNLPDMPKSTEKMAKAIDLKTTSMESFIEYTEKMLDDFKIPKSLAEINVPKNCAHRIAKKAMQDSAAQTNPKSISLEQLENIINTVIVKAR